MALTYKQKRRWSLVILLIGLPLYIVIASSAATWLDVSSTWLEFVVYLILGIVWALPFRKVFQGVGQADPDAPRKPDD